MQDNFDYKKLLQDDDSVESEYLHEQFEEDPRNTVFIEKISTVFSELQSQIDTLAEEKISVDQFEEIKPQLRGDKGDAYILTNQDKQDIAKTIDVPVVEKVIEKTEVIREQPIEITHETKIENPLDGQEIIEKINNDETYTIKQEKVEGLVERIQAFENRVIQTPQGIGGTSKNLINQTIDERIANGDIGSGGASAFTDLTDVPSSYTSQGGKGVRVKGTEDGLEFYTTTDSDEKVKVSANDTTAGYLNGKLVAGTGITLTENNNAGDETFTVATTITQYTDELAQDAVGTILVDSAEIDFTYTDATPSITASIVAGSIDETKLDTSVNASLDLADSAVQPATLASYVPYTGATGNVNLGTHTLTVHSVSADASDGLLLESANGTDIGQLGSANTANVTWYGSHNFDTVTASRVAQFGASKTLESSSVTNTELGYVAGVTSAIQTQLDNKQPLATVLTNTTASFTTSDETKLDYITVTQAVNLDTIESDTVTNNAKVSNATHTGEVTGSGALTVDKTAITNKSNVTAAIGDYVLISDVSDSDNLKKATVQSIIDLAGAGGLTIGQANMLRMGVPY